MCFSMLTVKTNIRLSVLLFTPFKSSYFISFIITLQSHLRNLFSSTHAAIIHFQSPILNQIIFAAWLVFMVLLLNLMQIIGFCWLPNLRIGLFLDFTRRFNLHRYRL